MPLLALLVIFIVVPLLELYVIFRVGEEIGYPLTILILAVDSIVGSLLLKSQGTAVWRRFSETLAAGRVPHREVLDGVMVIFGGAFLITPGFVTDVIGLLLLIPPTRVLMRRLVVRALGGRFVIGVATAGTRRRNQGPRPRGYDVEGTATEADDNRLEPRRPRLPQ
ncbi:MAG TPA: FxsA family protein [Thermoleophilaceae bacterium]|nr:FxsA family protein [Thermoleophilaceae bacterium]